jgi:hypothetical protein
VTNTGKLEGTVVGVRAMGDGQRRREMEAVIRPPVLATVASVSCRLHDRLRPFRRRGPKAGRL